MTDSDVEDMAERELLFEYEDNFLEEIEDSEDEDEDDSFLTIKERIQNNAN